MFQTAANHNISFQSSSGGYINLDGENFKAIVQIVSRKCIKCRVKFLFTPVGDLDKGRYFLRKKNMFVIWILTDQSTCIYSIEDF